MLNTHEHAGIRLRRKSISLPALIVIRNILTRDLPKNIMITWEIANAQITGNPEDKRQ